MTDEPKVVIGTPLQNAIRGLQWSADQGEGGYSATVSPAQCTALLEHIAELERRANPLRYSDGTRVQGTDPPVHPDTARALAEQRAREQEREAVGILAAAGATGAMLGILAAARKK